MFVHLCRSPATKAKAKSKREQRKEELEAQIREEMCRNRSLVDQLHIQMAQASLIRDPLGNAVNT